METWGIGAVLNYGGLTLALLSIVLWCVAGGTLGHFLARWVEKNPRSSKRVASAIILLTIFAVGFWLYVFGWSYRYDTSSWAWSIWVLLIVAGLSFVCRYMIVGNSEGVGFLEKNDKGEKNALLCIFSVLSFLVTLIMLLVCTPSYPWMNLPSRASYYAHQALKQADVDDANIRIALTNIEWYGYELPPLSKAFLYLKLGEKGQASSYFREHAKKQIDNMGGSERDREIWLGVSDFYEGKFELGARRFERAGENELAIMALFSGDALTNEKFNELSRKVTNKRMLSAIVREIGEAVLLLSVSPQKTDTEKLIVRIEQLERNLLKGADVKKEKSGDETNLKSRVGKEMLKFVRQRVTDPVWQVSYKLSGTLIIMNVVSVFFCLPLLFGSMYVVNMIWRDKLWDRIISVKLLQFPLNVWKLLARFMWAMSWHSDIARRISIRLAKMEQQVGMFNAEIERIRKTVFPIDIFLALHFVTRAKRTARRWSDNKQERSDIQYICSEVGKLSGKLIPQGTEESLSVITGLRRQADAIRNDYLKNIILYEQARTTLFEILLDLATVGDILEANHRGNGLTYYDLLGVGITVTADEIKRGYRSVIQAVHPDRNNGNAHLTVLAMQINAAYAVLSHQARRQAYDISRKF